MAQCKCKLMHPEAKKGVKYPLMWSEVTVINWRGGELRYGNPSMQFSWQVQK